MKKGIAPLVILGVAVFGLIAIEGVILTNFIYRMEFSTRAVKESMIIEAINKMEFVKRALPQAATYSFQQASYQTASRGGYDSFGSVKTYNSIPYWRSFAATTYPNYKANLNTASLSIFNEYLAEFEDEIIFPSLSAVIDEGTKKLKISSSGKFKYWTEAFEISDNPDVEVPININFFKVYSIGKEKFVDSDSIGNLVNPIASSHGCSDSQATIRSEVTSAISGLQSSLNSQYSSEGVSFTLNVESVQFDSSCNSMFEARVLVKVKDTSNSYLAYDHGEQTTRARNIELKFYVLSGNDVPGNGEDGDCVLEYQKLEFATGRCVETDVPTNGKPHASGTLIVDGNGNPMSLKGTNFAPHFGYTEYTDREHLDQIKSKGMNVIRLVFFWNLVYEGEELGMEEYFKKYMDPVVDYAEQNGIYIYFHFHAWYWEKAARFLDERHYNKPVGMPEFIGDGYPATEEGCNQFWTDFWKNEGPAKDDREQFLEAWRWVAQRYKGRSAMLGYEMWNEYYLFCGARDNPDSWEREAHQMHEEWAEMIRGIDSDVIIFLNEWNYKYRPEKPSFDNVVWVPAFYLCNCGGQEPYNHGSDYSELEDCGKGWLSESWMIGDYNQPVLFREYGLACGFDRPYDDDGETQWVEDSLEVIDELSPQNYGHWVYWHYTSSALTDEALNLLVNNIENDKFSSSLSLSPTLSLSPAFEDSIIWENAGVLSTERSNDYGWPVDPVHGFDHTWHAPDKDHHYSTVTSNPPPHGGDTSLKMEIDGEYFEENYGDPTTRTACELHNHYDLDYDDVWISFWAYIPSSSVGVPSGTWAQSLFKIWEMGIPNVDGVLQRFTFQMTIGVSVKSSDGGRVAGTIKEEGYSSGGEKYVDGSLTNRPIYNKHWEWETDKLVEYDKWFHVQAHLVRDTDHGQLTWYLNGDEIAKNLDVKTSLMDEEYRGIEYSDYIDDWHTHYNMYVGQNQEHGFWDAFDDLVVATEQVPSTYVVGEGYVDGNGNGDGNGEGTCSATETPIPRGCVSGTCCCSGVLPKKSCEEQCQDDGFASGTCLSGTAPTTTANYYGINDIVVHWKTPHIYSPEEHWSKFDIYQQLDILQNAGFNYLDVFGVPSDFADPTYMDFLILVRDDLHRRGMYFGIHLDATGLAGGQTKIDIINNVGGAGDRWRNTLRNIVTTLQPDSLNVFNEPLGDQPDQYASSELMTNYINFLVSCIDEVRAIKSDLIVVVNGLPFWDLGPLVAAGGIPRSNLWYGAHLYYQWGGEDPFAPGAAWTPQWVKDYWTGNLAAAKTGLYDYLLYYPINIQAALDAGYKVWLEEYGHHLDNPNAIAFARDAADFAEQYNLGFVLSGNNDLDNYPYTCWYNSDGTALNAHGEALLSAIPSITTAPTCSGESIGQDGCSSGQTCCCSGTVPPPTPSGKYVGFRFNGEYTPNYGVSVANRYSALISGSTPSGLWIVPFSKMLTYDASIDAGLTTFDNAGIKVFIQLGPNVPETIDQYRAGSYVGKAAISQLINGALSNYGDHPSVLGIGVDMENFGTRWDDYRPATNDEIISWVNQVNAYNSNFKLYLKHWLTSMVPSYSSLPQAIKDDVIFVGMPQGFASLNALLSNFKSWANYFSQSKVMYQIGYTRDKPWWSQLSNPPRDIAQAVFQEVPTCLGVYWHTQTITEVFPISPEIHIPAEADWVDGGVVLSPGPSGSWDVRLNGMITPSAVVKKDGTYFLYYLGADGDRGPPHNDGGPRHRALGVATSNNGIHFTKYSGNPIITYLPNNNDEEGIFSAGATLNENGNIVLYYGAMDAGSPTSTSVDGDVRLAVSSDGFHFTDYGDVLSHSDSSVWGYGDELFPVGTFQAGGQWNVYYIAKGHDAMWDIGLAWGSSKDRLSNTKEVLSLGNKIESCEPVWLDANTIALFFRVYSNNYDIEVRTVSPSTPAQLSTSIEKYNFNDFGGSTVFLDKETNTWFLYHLNDAGDEIKVKTASSAM